VSRTLVRGSVVSVRFDPSEGSEIRKTRPAVVVSNDAACRYDAVVQVVPVTRMPSRPLRSYESRVASPGSGLEQVSRLVANQVRTISKRRVGKVLGRVSADEQEKLDHALRIQLALGS
jgi:mRNA interferase MazF